RLERLIAELLDVARLTARRLELEVEELDLAELVRGVVAGMSEVASRTGSQLHCEVPQSVIGSWDRFRIEQVVGNLVTNALKYGLGKPVIVRLRTEGEIAVLEVQDRGIGIDPAQHARIFERFERAVSERHYGGLGLGLWISRQIIDACAGTIEVESTPAVGSLFRVRLPSSSAGEP
ncbi:MAG TPA: HAMP domain-containing sensor histidine kinase, partial [Nannocystaceae bacterium]|nr:HAMP domain-containing sensor histidine kinase [Nannocystaceae bacterium]